MGAYSTWYPADVAMKPVLTSSECSTSAVPPKGSRAALRYTAQDPTQIAPWAGVYLENKLVLAEFLAGWMRR
ncbi:hypothetical protein ATCV1_z827L [Acanthocystis turfacea chlorella virus 1]|uniref:Uncharacterized protein z827L n=1 Tax=Chlorovirus heliozoae TaxID=322019 RepID=A7KA87_9PHYC|nr:hypothetical protein ATCV1_z827L [Acanthocystis turfacea chlorella virus 1]ABT16961.1 hypothetical protein ATCV1_z827L [Acanthocystis turfacea chlorella virus 1]